MQLICRISLITFLAIFLTISLYGQYVSAQGEVNKSLILNELQAIAWGSPAQDSAVNQIMLSLRQDSKSHPVLLSDEAKKGKVILTILHLSMRVGDFYFLNPDSKKPRKKKYDINTDTISQHVKDLENAWLHNIKQLDSLGDELKLIIEDEEQTDWSRRASMMILSKMALPDSSLIHYFFEQINTLRLVSDYETDYGNTDVLGFSRSALANLYSTENWGVEGGSVNFGLLSYLITYWGDPTWVAESIQEDGHSYLEVLTFLNLTRFSQKPWILFDWIIANAEDPNTLILQAIADEMDQKKKIYYKNLENKGK